MSDPKPERPDLIRKQIAEAMVERSLETGNALEGSVDVALYFAALVEAQQQAPLPSTGVSQLADRLDQVNIRPGADEYDPQYRDDASVLFAAATALRALARERDRLQHKMEQYQLQLEDGWAAHIDKLNEVVTELAALRERLEAAQRDTERLISEARVAVQALVNAGWDFKARALQAAIDSAARSAAQGDGEASDGD